MLALFIRNNTTTKHTDQRTQLIVANESLTRCGAHRIAIDIKYGANYRAHFQTQMDIRMDDEILFEKEYESRNQPNSIKQIQISARL